MGERPPAGSQPPTVYGSALGGAPSGAYLHNVLYRRIRHFTREMLEEAVDSKGKSEYNKNIKGCCQQTVGSQLSYREINRRTFGESRRLFLFVNLNEQITDTDDHQAKL